MKRSKKYPIKLRATFNRTSEYYQTIYDLSIDDWEKLTAPRVNSELHEIREKLKQIDSSAYTFSKDLDPFSFADFEKGFIRLNPLFRHRKKKSEVQILGNDEFDYTPFYKKFPLLLETIGKSGHISYAYFHSIKKLLREGRIGTAVNYHCSYRSLIKFRGDVTLTLITPTYLKEYENVLKSRNLSRSTVGIYIRPIRTIFNDAIEDGILKREKHYPFGKRKYRIPSSRNIKKALDISDVQKIYYYQCNPEQTGEQQARDYWLFSYFGNGINPKDIANLKYKNIDEDYIIFERSKTEHTLRTDPKPITIFINDDMKAIIERWGTKNKSPNNFIFPILEHGLTPLREYELVQNFVGFINEWMRRILQNLGINKKATTYVARHTFSTVLKRSGASTEFIQEALGHTDVRTTESYLDSFGRDMKKEYAHHLIAFKKEHEANAIVPSKNNDQE